MHSAEENNSVNFFFEKEVDGESLKDLQTSSVGMFIVSEVINNLVAVQYIFKFRQKNIAIFCDTF